MEGNGFIIGVKPVGSKGSTGSFEDIDRVPSSFALIIAFLID